MKLVACSTVSLQNTIKTKADRIIRGHQYWSVAYDDVASSVDREIKLRGELSAAQKERDELIKQEKIQGEALMLSHKKCIEFKNKAIQSEKETSAMQSAWAMNAAELEGKNRQIENKLSQAHQQISERDAVIKVMDRVLEDSHGCCDEGCPNCESYDQKIEEARALKPSPSHLERVMREATKEKDRVILNQREQADLAYHNGRLDQKVESHKSLESERAKAARLAEALHMCGARAGIPNMLDACVAVTRTAREALKSTDSLSWLKRKMDEARAEVWEEVNKCTDGCCSHDHSEPCPKDRARQLREGK